MTQVTCWLAWALIRSLEEEGVEGIQSWKGIRLCLVAFETFSEGQREALWLIRSLAEDAFTPASLLPLASIPSRNGSMGGASPRPD